MSGHRATRTGAGDAIKQLSLATLLTVLDAAIGCGSATGRGGRSSIFHSSDISKAQISAHLLGLRDSHTVAQTLHASAVTMCQRQFCAEFR